MQMIPATPHGTHSLAEKRVFDLLRASFSTPTDNFVAYHSLNLTRHAYKRFGEIDFLICGKQGIYVLEVKGGKIACEAGIWKYKNRYGEVSQSAESPFKQAASALQGLMSKLRSEFPENLISQFHIGFGVIFPDCEWNIQGAEWDSHTLADARKIKNFEKWLNDMISYWQHKDFRKRNPDEFSIKKIKSYLRPEFETAIPLYIQTSRIEEQIARLTQDQMAMLDVVEANPRVLCSGGAGTGKTFLAMELARRWTADGSQVLLTCKSPWLKRYLESKFTIPNLTVATISSIPVAAKRIGANGFDALIVDEGQDLFDIGSLDLMDKHLKNGFQDGRWCFFFDINNQSGLFGQVEDKALQYLENLKPVRVPLRKNCRNTRIILETVKETLGADMGIQGAGEGPVVVQQTVYSKEASAIAISNEIHRLIDKGGLSYNELTILSSEPFYHSSVSLLDESILRNLIVLDEYAMRNFPPDKISFSEIQNFKGLENEAIIVADLPVPNKGMPMTLHYIGMSRARAVLSMVFLKSIMA